MNKLVILSGLLAATFVGTANATLINADLGQGAVFAGTGVEGGGVWNGITGVGQQNVFLSDSTGATTTIQVQFFSINDFVDTTGGTVPANNPATAALFEDYGETAFNNSIALQLSGLVPLATYDLTIYAAGSSGIGDIFNANFAGTTTGTTRGAFVAGDNYLRHQITADANGMFFTGAAGTNGNNAIINGFQISTVPEPSSIAFVAGGIAGFLMLRRRLAAAVRPVVR